MALAIITGSAGLVGAAASRRLAERGFEVWGIDNDLRRMFFGDEASTRRTRERLEATLPGYEHFDVDVRDRDAIDGIFRAAGRRIEVVLHAAAQPSHDWAASDPHTDFTVNANGTLAVLEAVRAHAPDATVLFISTNKVYGDAPNQLPLVELATRWDLEPQHPLWEGMPETVSIDRRQHSPFGVSKTAADLIVQEYGRYFELRTVVFRAGCLTGPEHAGAELHGFLAYLMKCTATRRPYTVFGYGGKQVRDNIHCSDLLSACEEVIRDPRGGAVYNLGGGRATSASLLEAIDLCQEIAGEELDWSYDERHRRGDHKWWISDVAAFRADYPDWRAEVGLRSMLEEIHAANRRRWLTEAS